MGKIMKRALLSIVVTVLAVTHAAGAPSPKQPFAKEIELATHALELTLKDRASVQYRNVKVVSKKSGTKTICIEFNAKNSYGGYSGFQTLTAPLNDPAAIFLIETAPDSTQVERCNTDEAEAAAAAAAQALRKELRKTRRENIERDCAEKRQAIEQAGGPDVQAKKDKLARACEDLI